MYGSNFKTFTLYLCTVHKTPPLEVNISQQGASVVLKGKIASRGTQSFQT